MTTDIRVEILEDRKLLVVNGLLISSDLNAGADLNENNSPASSNTYALGNDSSNDDNNTSTTTQLDQAEFVPRILNGSPLDEQEFPAVGIVGNRRNPDGFGTGTLIDPQWVLTAGHVSRGVGRKAGLFILNGVTYQTVRVIKHPRFRIAKLGTDNANDIALWKLLTPVAGITPSPIDRSIPEVGDELTLVGYGAGGTTSGEGRDFGNKRQGSTPIDQVSSTLISWDFDHPEESNTGHGDSGGPAYIDRDGVDYVAGITSGGEKDDASFGDHSYDTRVEAYASWIDEIITRGGSRERTTAAARRSQTDDILPEFTPRIINGEPIPESTFPSVGKASSILGPCTATLISSQWVLTAGHCSSGLGDSSGTFEIDGVTYNTIRVIVHPKYKAGRLGTNAGNDMALWKLDRPVTEVSPSPLVRSAPKVGANLTLVGYGYGGDATGASGEYGTKRQGQTRLDGRSSKLLRWNFDSPEESNTAAGDSGGPAFVLVDGVYHLAGVTSGGQKSNSALGDVAADTRVDKYVKWIDATIAKN